MGKAAQKISERAMEAGGNLPKPAEGAAPPAHLAQYAAEDAGKGTSQAAEDNLVPLVYVLQPMSPQVDRRDAAYVEGAEPGDIWLRNAPPGHELVKGNVGILAQPCYFYKDVSEWVPRDDGGGKGNGFVGRHAVDRAALVPGAVQDPEDPNHWTSAGGDHDLVETRNHVMLVHVPGRALRYLLPLSSTGHSVSRAWMSKMNDKVVQDGDAKGKPYPSYAYLYRLTTEQRSNAQGKWFSLVAEDERWATPDEYLSGRRLNELFAAGELRAEAPEAAKAADTSRADEVI
jgi:hypothetical protein